MESKRLEKMGAYVTALAVLFMLWQAWRDLHVDGSLSKERIAKLEVKVEKLEGK